MIIDNALLRTLNQFKMIISSSQPLRCRDTFAGRWSTQYNWLQLRAVTSLAVQWYCSELICWCIVKKKFPKVTKNMRLPRINEVVDPQQGEHHLHDCSSACIIVRNELHRSFHFSAWYHRSMYDELKRTVLFANNASSMYELYRYVDSSGFNTLWASFIC